ncbi:Arginine biosynthesis protein ArgJ [Marinobacter nitratireducens]|uniref:Arginine biosynthesis protein ArgJ n=1 Tax=Marinobacter nitratireducens TaxID=1137280 RepID=A0A072N7C1_9GAMM|nr:VWA domain-containing protein [Marinobacter nitratireducens]KEF33112.1 Arginine biosynthesis protein ArgJ [Marinobacter nitratireducens]
MKGLKSVGLGLIAGSLLAACASERVGEQSVVQQEKQVSSKFLEKRMVAASAPLMQADMSGGAHVQPVPGQIIGSKDRFESVEQNPVHRVVDEPVSTFSSDVDTASYSFSRRRLSSGRLPEPDAIRLEEWLNYFDYDYPAPERPEQPFKPTVTVTDSPWKAGNKLLHIGIQGYELPQTTRPRANLVFLLDVSGSMSAEDKLPLLKQSLTMMLNDMPDDDTVAIVVYAGASGVVLPPTPVKEKANILMALNHLQAGGSTAGGEGIQLAYQLAEANFDEKAVNRVLLATDGDFNVGMTDRDALEGLIARKRKQGIYLSVLGFGAGNYNDHLMQTLAQNGNGVAAYIDNLNEARKVLVTEATSSLFPIAEDLKIQVEFNPATVQEYRLLGYETRALKREDFNNDAVDAGDIGAEHSVTAIYEITPVGGRPLISPSRYETELSKPMEEKADEYAFLKLRYKLPGEKASKHLETPIPAHNTGVDEALRHQETAFATAVAGAGQLLSGGKYTGDWTLEDAITLAQANRGDDLYGYRAEFVQLLRLARELD